MTSIRRTAITRHLTPLLPMLVALGLAAIGSVFVPRATMPVSAPPRAPAPVAVVQSVTPPVTPPAYVIRSRLRSASLNHGDWRWDDRNAPSTGPMFVAIDTASQTLSVFRDGHAIGVAVIVFGDDRKPTPLGSFRIKSKAADYWSRTYNAPMPYALRLTDDGVFVHGSSEIAEDLASHGCVGLPTPFARKLFGAVGVGDPVRITHGVFLHDGDRIPLG